ncbi:hypothetical protein [Chamaesiphon minutus]|uniref:MatP C-terminal ribbon-helix-helix domain-containing protein n=1 Tax=Chamaesiphon minutus (strain ATCC 27169 / PCC 6605) TaxID=1173020 RepID=K9UHP7_CHAP6|nr:hypothetical protein [Chamaesiphon minutus]AFY94637.1 hypothetical protein Cha6605_3657 [Chamaesiphon minutus PCC 6605]
MEPTTNWDDAISSLTQFEFDLDDDLGGGLGDFLSLDELAKDNLFGFVRVGIAADRIRKRKLWQCAKIYKDWNDYCTKGLGKTAWYINRTIDAANVVMTLISAGFKILPTCEAQCRPLVKLLGVGLDAIADVWTKVVSAFTPDKITAGKILAIAEPDRADNQQSKIDRQLVDKLAERAKQRGMTLNEYLEEMLDEDESQEKYWEDFLENKDKDSEPELNAEMQAIVDRVEYQWLKPEAAKKSILEAGNEMIDRMDSFFNSMLRPKPA